MDAAGEENRREMKLEEAFEKLDDMLAELESGDISLEECFERYQEGMKLLKQCNDIILISHLKFRTATALLHRMTA